MISVTSAREAPQRTAAFKAIDTNADGKVDKPEYRAMLTTIGFPHRFDDFLTQIDTDKDGLITVEEYKANVEQ